MHGALCTCLEKSASASDGKAVVIPRVLDNSNPRMAKSILALSKQKTATLEPHSKAARLEARLAHCKAGISISLSVDTPKCRQ